MEFQQHRLWRNEFGGIGRSEGSKQASWLEEITEQPQ